MPVGNRAVIMKYFSQN